MFHLFKSVTRDQEQPSAIAPLFTINKIGAVTLILAATLSASACGTPAVGVSVINPGIVMNATTLPTATIAPTVTAVPTKPITSVPTGATSGTALSTNATAAPAASVTPLVVGYLLYGTPTFTPGPAGQGAPVTATPLIRASATSVPTTAGPAATATTVSQPTATTASSFGGGPITSTPIIRATKVSANETPTVVPTTAPTTASATDSAAATVAATAAVTTAAGGNPPAAAGGTSPTPDAWTNMNLVGDAAKGQALFQGAAGCNACHNANSTAQLVGPGLKGVAARAPTRRPGYTAIQYIHESIVLPNAFVVPGFSPNIMPQTFAQTLTPQQIADLIAYLLTL